MMKTKILSNPILRSIHDNPISLSLNDGFTLMELIVVIVLLGVLTGFGIPRIYNLTKDNMKGTSRQFIAQVVDLKNRSVKDQKTLDLIIDIENKTLGKATLPEEIMIHDVQLPNGDTLRSEPVTLHFYPNGFSDSAAVHLENDDGEYLTLFVEPFLTKVRVYQKYWEYTD